MTNREFYTAIANATGIDAELVEFANAAIEKLDASNVKRAATAAEKRAAKEEEKAPKRDAIVACLTAEGKTASDLITEAGLEGQITPQAIPSLLKPLIEAGEVLKVDVTVAGKKGKCRGYVLA